MKTRIAFVLALIATPVLAQKQRNEIRDVRTPPPTPACSSRGVHCIADSARSVSHECCMSAATAEWLIFPAVGDSLEFFALVAPQAGATPLITLGIRGLRRFWQEHLPGLTAPFLRQRMPSAGTYTLTIDLDMPAPQLGVPFELRMREARVSIPYVQSAIRLMLRDTVGQYRVTTVRTGVTGNAALVRAGVYRLLGLPGDTLVVCKLPCRLPKRLPIDGAPATLAF